MTAFADTRRSVDAAVQAAERFAAAARDAERDVQRHAAAAAHQQVFGSAAARRVEVAADIEPSLLELSRSWVRAVGENAAWVRDDSWRARDLLIDSAHESLARVASCCIHVDRLLVAIADSFVEWSRGDGSVFESAVEQRDWFYGEVERVVALSRATQAVFMNARAVVDRLPGRGGTPRMTEWTPSPEFEEMVAKAAEMAQKK